MNVDMKAACCCKQDASHVLNCSVKGGLAD